MLRQPAEDKKVGAFASLKSEIEALVSTLNENQQQDLKDQKWCQRKLDALTQELADLEENMENLSTKKEGHENKASSYKDKVQNFSSMTPYWYI